MTTGDVVWHDGQRYRVLTVAADGGDRQVVTVERYSDETGGTGVSEQDGILLAPLEA